MMPTFNITFPQGEGGAAGQQLTNTSVPPQQQQQQQSQGQQPQLQGQQQQQQPVQNQNDLIQQIQGLPSQTGATDPTPSWDDDPQITAFLKPFNFSMNLYDENSVYNKAGKFVFNETEDQTMKSLYYKPKKSKKDLAEFTRLSMQHDLRVQHDFITKTQGELQDALLTIELGQIVVRKLLAAVKAKPSPGAAELASLKADVEHLTSVNSLMEDRLYQLGKENDKLRIENDELISGVNRPMSTQQTSSLPSREQYREAIKQSTGQYIPNTVPAGHVQSSELSGHPPGQPQTYHQEQQRVVHVQTPLKVTPPFNTGLEDFLTWKIKFEHLFHNKPFDDATKMYHLRASVIGEAEQFLNHFPIDGRGYLEAWNMLTNKYASQGMVTRHFHTKLQNAPQATDFKSLQELYFMTRTAISHLKMAGTPVDGLVPTIEKKLSPELREKVSRKVPLRTSIINYDMDSFLQLMSEEVDFQRSIYDGSDTAATTQSTPQITSLATATASNPGSTRIPCVYCKGTTHPPVHCPMITSAKERLSFLKQKGRCTNCLSQYHRHLECPQYKKGQVKGSCIICHANHHTSVHEAFTPKSQTRPTSGKK